MEVANIGFPILNDAIYLYFGSVCVCMCVCVLSFLQLLHFPPGSHMWLDHEKLYASDYTH